MEFLSFVFGVWVLGVFVSSPYFWWKRTDKAAAPLIRRVHAAGYGICWPVFVVKFFVERNQEDEKAAEQRRLEQRILEDDSD